MNETNEPLTTLHINSLQIVNWSVPELITEKNNSYGQISSLVTVRVPHVIDFAQIGVHFDPKRPEQPWSIYTSTAAFRCFDVPIRRKHIPRTGPMLEDELIRFLHDEIQRYASQLAQCFLTESPVYLRHSAQKPASWEGRDLMVPVEYLQVYGFETWGDLTTAHLRFGQQFVLWRALRFFDKILRINEGILSSELTKQIADLLRDGKAKPGVDASIRGSGQDFQLTMPEGIDPDTVPDQSLYFA